MLFWGALIKLMYKHSITPTDHWVCIPNHTMLGMMDWSSFNLGIVRNDCPIIHFSCPFLLLSLFFLYNYSHYHLYLFSNHSLLVYTYDIPLVRQPHPFFLPYHVVNHMIAMYKSHGFWLLDHECIWPITLFVGFHICLLLETKHGPCTSLYAGQTVFNISLPLRNTSA